MTGTCGAASAGASAADRDGPGPAGQPAKHAWQDIWAGRDVQIGRDVRLADLIAADGYDNSFSRISEDAWRSHVTRWATDLQITPEMSVYEIGCGAGAFLHVFYQMGCRVGGLDLSERLIEVARAAMPGGDFRVGDAATFGSERADLVCASGVFMYFPSHRYARDVLAAMARAARHAVFLGELPDADKAAQARASRIAALGEAEYARRYAGLEHLHFRRPDMAALLRAQGCAQVLTRDSAIPSYGNAAFRFDLAGFRAGR